MAVFSPTDVINQWLSADFLNAMIAPYIALLGDAFWLLLYFILAFSLYYKTRSFGVLAIFNMLFSFALIYHNVWISASIVETGRIGVGAVAQLFAYGLAGLTLAATLYRVFVER